MFVYDTDATTVKTGFMSFNEISCTQLDVIDQHLQDRTIGE